MNLAEDRLRVVISEALNSSLGTLGADLEVMEVADLWFRPDLIVSSVVEAIERIRVWMEPPAAF